MCNTNRLTEAPFWQSLIGSEGSCVGMKLIKLTTVLKRMTANVLCGFERGRFEFGMKRNNSAGAGRVSLRRMEADGGGRRGGLLGTHVGAASAPLPRWGALRPSHINRGEEVIGRGSKSRPGRVQKRHGRLWG
ncbi:hypothetical protein SKAU_G00044060 [Synaphobranchus kaupii]|uniref:Uncharacterized protein n=1 Tax=Synaphobranchus kaupii TaxID=118154 RepID=A0A9Q1G238_SYNKA|nr:hypothetical protein SKAU_G00044060 [Synaphobranchus kaupii]